MATTNNKELSERMQLFRSHGVTRNPELMSKLPGGDWYYQQVDLGFNYRMTELQAALGISQMKRLDEFVAKRHILKRRYDSLFGDFPVIAPCQDSNCYSALHLYPIQLELNKISKSRKQVFEKMRNSGIGVNVHYIPIYNHPYFQNLGFKKGNFPNAEKYSKGQ